MTNRKIYASVIHRTERILIFVMLLSPSAVVRFRLGGGDHGLGLVRAGCGRVCSTVGDCEAFSRKSPGFLFGVRTARRQHALHCNNSGQSDRFTAAHATIS